MSRGQSGRIWLLIICIAIGVAARVCVGSFTGTVARALADQARPLLGADIEVVANQPLTAEQRAALSELMPTGARTLDELGLVTMALASRSRHAAVVEVLGVERGYPLFGELRVAVDEAGRSPGPAKALTAGSRSVYVQRELLARLAAHVGDPLTLGATQLTIAGILVEDPGLGANPFVLGPRVLVDAATLVSTGLAGPGARVRHLTMIATADPLQGEGVANALRTRWKLPERSATGFGGRVESGPGIAIRTARQSQESVARVFDRLGDYLRLVSLIALLLGGIGVASLVRGFVAERLDAIATLQVLGAPLGRIMGMLFIQAGIIGLAGGLLGGTVGAGVENLMVVLLQGELPAADHHSLDLGAFAWGMILALSVTVVFAALPVIEISGMKPLAVLRGDQSPPRSRLLALAWGVLAIALFTALAVAESHSLTVGSMLIASLVLGGGTTWLVGGAGLAALARVHLPSFGLRHGLANLARPGFRPHAAVVTISLASLLFSTLAVYQESLQHELGEPYRADLPSLFAIDIQPDQREEFKGFLAKEFAMHEVSMAPLVLARFRGLASPASAATAPAAGHEGDGDRASRDREQRLSWREKLVADERLVAGQWMDDRGDRVEASLEKRYAERIGAHLGDLMTYDIQGVCIEATVTSIRAVRWASLRPNFLVLLSPHALRDAPQTWIAALPTLPPEARTAVQARLAERFPTVSTFDVSEAAARIGSMVSRIALAIRFIGLFSLAAGVMVLIGIALSTARERRADAALLKVLGAGRWTLVLSLLAEFGALGGLAGILGQAEAIPLAWALTSRFDLPLSIPLSVLCALALAVALVCAAAGLVACIRVLRVPPLAVLRDG